MSDEGWVRVMENGNDCLAPISESLHMFRGNGARREHRGALESTKDIILPGKATARFVVRKVAVKSKALATTVTLRKKFAGHNVDAVGIAMSRETFAPRAKSMERGIVAMRCSLVEVLGILDQGENSAIADDDFFASDV
jgi:hypothetical protein